MINHIYSSVILDWAKPELTPVTSAHCRDITSNVESGVKRNEWKKLLNYFVELNQ